MLCIDDCGIRFGQEGLQIACLGIPVSLVNHAINSFDYEKFYLFGEASPTVL